MTDAALADLDSLDKETLKALLIRERSSNARQIEHLKLVIEKYRRMLFGAKSEKLAGELEQLELQLEELETSEAAEEAAEQKSNHTQSAGRPPRRPRRKPLPEHLPREVVMHMPEHDCCPDCGGALRQFGEDVSEQLERIPATFKVIRMCGRSSPATTVSGSLKRPHLHGRSSVGWLARRSWPMC